MKLSRNSKGRSWRPLFAFLGLLMFSPLPAAACDKGIATISGSDVYPPLSWREGNTLVGMSIDMVRDMLHEVGIEARPDAGGPWKRVLQHTRDGHVDILMGVRKSPKSEQFLHYLEPALTPSVQSVFVSAQRPFAYQRWEDLRGKSGSITLGTHFDDAFDAYAERYLSLQAVRKIKQNFMKLDRGRVDYVLGPGVSMQLYLEQSGYAERIRQAEVPLLVISEYVAISRKSPCMAYAPQLQKALARIVTSEDAFNERMEAAFVKWMSEEVPRERGPGLHQH